MSTLSTGATVNLPAYKTEKIMEAQGSRDVVSGVASMQGRRPDFEDSHVLSIPIAGYPEYSFVGVFDGHGGTIAAKYASKHLLPAILNRPEFQSGTESGDAVMLRTALVQGFFDLDRSLRQYMIDSSNDRTIKRNLLHGGCTACTALIGPGKIFIANAGDSRSCLVRAGRVFPLSRDHKPTDPGELQRVEAAGEFVSDRGRINDNLNVSRGLGDHDFKDEKLPQPAQAVSPEPGVTIVDRSPTEDEFIILACDGVWDVFSNEAAAAFVANAWNGLKGGRVNLAASQASSTSMAQSGGRQWNANEAAAHVSELLADEALAKGSKDNITAIVLAFPAVQ